MSANSLQQDVDISWRIWVGTITTVVPATFAVALRFTARYVASAGLWWDDWTILASLAVNWAMAAIRWVQVLHYGYGRHAAFLAADKVQSFQKSFLAVQVTYFTNAVTTKASLLLLYYRIFGIIRGFCYALWVSGGIIVSYFIACMIVCIAGCQPVSYFWNKHQPGKCIDEVNFFRWNGFTNMLLDFLVLCLPLSMTWQIRASWRQKFVISGIFLLGGFVCVVSILRIIAFNKSNPKDPTYTTINTAMWSSIEQSVGIVCACLPTLRPLVRRIYETSKTTATESSTGSQSRIRSTNIHLSNLGSTQTTSSAGFIGLGDDDSLDEHSGIYSGPKGRMKSKVSVGQDGTGRPVEPVPSGIRLEREIHQTTSSI
ncbi:hypothetical protein DTO271D3_4472 [Paecilomyces variotii]|nr:hypothetical protein DTO271D3_4472 [Paecilomyces variotii]